jgi:hypothetical protein
MVKIDHDGLLIEAEMDPKNPGMVKEAVLVYGGKWRLELGGGHLSVVKATATRKARAMSDDFDRLARWNGVATS